MDRVIYLAMTGARHVMAQQSTTANNLANLNTSGFRAQLDSFRAVPVQGPSLPTRAFVVDATAGSDFSQGVVQQTGRPLDVAIKGAGWIALQAEDGTETYTRNGNLNVNENGVLIGPGRHAVAGDAGPITIPVEASVLVAPDGTVSSINAQGAATVVGRIRLVNPPSQQLVRGDDGLFRTESGKPADADASVQLASGSLEGSNVNAVDAMVSMISLGRSFELQMNLLKKAESNEQKASQILALN